MNAPSKGLGVGSGLQADSPREMKALEQQINRLGSLKDSLGSITMRASRLASELLGPVPESDKGATAKETFPGLIGTLSAGLDGLEFQIGELGYTIERMESLA